jgi:REP element-mobilizing transposase RayT
MARPLRIEYPGAWYHIMTRGRRKEAIFFDDKDYQLFMTVLGECSKLFSLEVHAYSLMLNHYHLLVHTPKGNLSRAMRHLNGVYTQRINSRHKFEGSLFKGRFKSILVEEDMYFLELLRYIHRNPVKANITKSLDEHKWTSHRAYMRENERPEWLRTESALLKFGKHVNKAKRKLDAFVKNEVPPDLEKLLNRIKWPVLLGGKEFKKKIKDRIQGKKIDIREVPQHKKMRQQYTAEDVRKFIVESLDWDRNFLLSRRIREHISCKKAFVYVCRECLQITASAIREEFGDISYAAITKYHKQARKEIKEKEGCYSAVKKIEKIIK